MGAKVKKELPVFVSPPILSYLMFAQPLSVLYANCKNPYDFVLDQFIQLHVETICPHHSENETRLSFYVPLYAQWEPFEAELVFREDIEEEDILRLFRDELNNGYYVFTILDEYYIHLIDKYQTKHFEHDYLLSGYNDEEQKFTGLFFIDGFYKQDYLSYAEVREGFLNCRSPLFAYIKLKVKPGYDARCHLDKARAITLISDYLNGTNSFNWYSGFGECVFGLDVYDRLFSLEMPKEKRILDIRAFCVLEEHKRIMKDRIEQVFGLPDLAGQYQNVLKLSSNTKLLAMKYMRNGLSSTYDSIVKNILKMKEMERNLLQKVLQQVEDI